ncbi:MAG: GH3 auxin-responsive promoter family protein [Bacteroidota bacterium]
MPFLNSIASWFMKKRMHQVELFMKYPHDVQEEWLRQLVNSGKDTEFGKKHDFKSITNYEQFKQHVPIQDYESLKPYIERTRRGEQNLLWNSEIKWFAKSSGTTDKSKFIPVSKEFLDGCHYNGGRDMITFHCINNADTKLFTGKNLALGGSFKTDHFGEYDSFHGDVSAIIIQNLPMWAEYFRAPDVNIALMDNWEDKLEKMANSMADENVTSLAGVPSWMLVLIKRILELKKVDTLKEVWPNLEVYFHGGVSFTPYRELFDRLFNNNDVAYLQLYNASEGFFGIQDERVSNEMLLMLDYGIYYEFIPVSELQKENPRVYNLDEVQKDKDYSLMISTNAGLWRYQVGDTIRFTNLSPYRFIITGRTKQHINVFGEELMIHNAEFALKTACEKTRAHIVDFTAAPVFMNEATGAHEWLIEFEQEPNNLDYFKSVLDDTLKQINSDYEAKRFNNYVLQFPVIRALPKGTFYNWLKANNRLGGQFKVPRLSNDRKILEDVLKSVNL